MRRYWHLPAGHAAGLQSRNRLLLRPLLFPAPWAALFLAWTAATASTSHPKNGLSAPVVILIGTAVGGLWVGLMWGLVHGFRAAGSPYLRTRPPLLPGVSAELTSTEVMAGGATDATVTLTKVPRQGFEAELVCVAFVHRQSPLATTGLPWYETTVVHEIPVRVPAEIGTHTVRLEVPKTAQFSYEGRNLAVAWFLDLHHGRRRSVAPLWVAPAAGPTFDAAHGEMLTRRRSGTGNRYHLQPVRPGVDTVVQGTVTLEHPVSTATVVVRLVEQCFKSQRFDYRCALMYAPASVTIDATDATSLSFTLAMPHGVPALMEIGDDGIYLEAALAGRNPSFSSFPVSRSS